MEQLLNSKRKSLSSIIKQENLSNTSIYNILKGNIILKEKFKEEGNFIYIYSEISNLFELFSGNLKVIKKEIPQLYVKKSGSNDANIKSLIYIKECLFLYDKIPFTIRIEEELYPISIYKDEKVLFDLPIFDVKNIFITIIENGVSRNILCQKNKLHKLNSKIIKEVFSKIEIFVENTEFKDNAKFYYDDKLQLEESDCYIDYIIKKFLEEKFFNRCITDKDLKFNQSVKSYITDKEECQIVFKYVTPSYIIGKTEDFVIKTHAKTLVSELSNDSKVKMIITRKQSFLVNKRINLKKFIYNVLLKEYSLKIKSAIPKVKVKPLISTFRDIIEEYNENNGTFTIVIDYKVCNKVASPIIDQIITCDGENDFKWDLLEEQTIFDESKKSVLLRQYYYVETSLNKKKEKYLITLLFTFKQLICKYKGNNYYAIIPYCIKEKCSKNKLYDEQSFAIIKKYADVNAIYIERSSNLKVIEYNEKELNNKTILLANQDIINIRILKPFYNYNLFSNEKEVKFFDVDNGILEFENFCYNELDDEDFIELKEYYKK